MVICMIIYCLFPRPSTINIIWQQMMFSAEPIMLARYLSWIILVAAVYSADPTFKTCEQSDFCNRLRYKHEESGYCVGEDLGGNDSVRIFTLESNKTSKDLLLTVSFLENAYRITIDEPEPSPRFRLSGVLDGTPKPARVQNVSRKEKISFHSDDGVFVIELSPCPFEIVVYKDGYHNPVARFNAKDRLTVETDEPNVAIALDINFPGAQRAYGIPEHADYLPLRTTTANGTDPYRLFNLDTAFYQLESTVALYGAVPVLYAHSTSQTTGVFWHNSAETWVEIENRDDSVDAYFISESGVLDLFVLRGPTPKDAVRQYASLTGIAPLPQYFTLGHHQCRWNYDSEDDVKTVVAEFDNHDLPLDVIWLDIEYTDSKKYFTWDPVNFSDPLEMQANLTATNRKLVTIIDPHIKKETGYFVYDEALAQDFFVHNANGSVFEGDCWPGLSSYIDFLNPEALEFYAGLYAFSKFNGSTENTYIWNDMNEPSVFDESIEKTFPKDLVHYGNVKHRDVHNIYGYLQTQGTYQGLKNRSDSNKRPFILTRSHFAGSQRYTAVWTGDNTADWGYLAAGISMCLTEALAGISFCGADVGGFFYNPPVDLLQRWYQAGVWLPFYRAHANMGTDRREPYLFPEDVQARIRAALRQRYAHLPLWYTLFWEHYRSGDPVIRPLFYNYPGDANVLDIDAQLLVGTSVLVAAVAKPNVTSIDVYFPGGGSERWYDIDNYEIQRGVGLQSVNVTLDRIPVYYRGGSIISRKDTPRLSSVDTHNDPYSLYIFPDDDGNAEGTLYIDDLETFDYQKGNYTYIRFTNEDNTLKMQWEDVHARYPVKAKIDKVILAHPPANIKSASITTTNGLRKEVSVTYGTNVLQVNNLGLDLSDPFILKWL